MRHSVGMPQNLFEKTATNKENRRKTPWKVQNKEIAKIKKKNEKSDKGRRRLEDQGTSRLPNLIKGNESIN